MVRTSVDELPATGRLSTRAFHWLFAGKIGQRLADGSECPEANWLPTTAADVTSAASTAIRRIVDRLLPVTVDPFWFNLLHLGVSAVLQFGPPRGGDTVWNATCRRRA